MSDNKTIQDKPSWWLGAINIIPGVCLFTWLFYILLKKKYPKKAKSCMLGGAIGATICCILPTIVYGHFSVLAILAVAYFILYFTHESFMKTKHIECVKKNECEMDDKEQPIISTNPSVSMPKNEASKMKPFFALLKKIFASKKGRLALYLCYELVMLCIYYSDNGFLESRIDGGGYYYHALNIETLLEFILISLLPLLIYWIVRLFIEASKENK